MKRGFIIAMALVIAASLGFTAYAAASPGSKGLKDGSASVSSSVSDPADDHGQAVSQDDEGQRAPEKITTVNPAGKEIELPENAQAPEKNPVWNGSAPGKNKDSGPNSATVQQENDNGQGSPQRITTTNPSGKEIELPENAKAPDKNPVWNGGAPGQNKDKDSNSAVVQQEDSERHGPPEKVTTVNPAGKEIELPGNAKAPEKNPVWNGGAPGLNKDSSAGQHEANGQPERVSVTNPAGKTLQVPSQAKGPKSTP